jgi:hypothetical protein
MFLTRFVQSFIPVIGTHFARIDLSAFFPFAFLLSQACLFLTPMSEFKKPVGFLQIRIKDCSLGDIGIKSPSFLKNSKA